MPYKNKEDKVAHNKKWRAENYERTLELNGQSWARNKEYKRAHDKEVRDAYRIKAIEIMGGKCVHCGYDDFRALQIDHIDGSGAEDRRKRPSRTLTRLIAQGLEPLGNYQLLCANCNWIKKLENKEVGRPKLGESKYGRKQNI